MVYDSNLYRAKALRVIDGDTVHIEVDLGLRVKRELDIRLIGINAPEIRGETVEAGKAASEHLHSLLFLDGQARTLVVAFAKGKSFDINRWICAGVWDAKLCKPSIQYEMIRAGHAVIA